MGTMTNGTRAADGAHTKNGVPTGYTSLTPHVVASPASRALEFYRAVFGARVVDEIRMGDFIGHATLELASGRFTVSDALEAYELVAPSGGPASMTLAIYVPDVDATIERAIAAGARLREPVSTFVSGDRFGSIVDPFGVRWSVMTRVEDLSPEDSAERVRRWAATQAPAC